MPIFDLKTSLSPMKPTLFCILLLSLLPSLIFAQESPKGNGKVTTLEQKISAFDGIQVGGIFTVNIIWGDKQKVVVETDENLMSFVEVKVKNNVLVVSATHTLKNVTKLSVYITTDRLESLTVDGAADVSARMPIATDLLKLKVSGGADLNLKLTVATLDCQIEGASSVKLVGTASELKASVSGSGDLRAKDLITENATVAVEGQADAYIYVKNELHARASGAGNIFCAGSPQKADDIQSSGAGSVEVE
ncbi:MAG: DUF2807 domain-containing protein [Bacteroidetes bacterium]|nr:MAG: DUF2807 domain-containing protein [Bacteroidota bacterium]